MGTSTTTRRSSCLTTITRSVPAVPSPMTRRSSWLTTTTSSVATATTLSIPTTSPLMTTMVRPKCPLVLARGRAPRGAGVPIMLRLSDAQAAARASMILRSINIDNSHAQSQHLQRFVLVHLPRLRQDTEEHGCHKRPHASPPACTGTCAIPMPAAQTQAWDDLCSRRATCPCVLRCCHQRSCVRRYQHSSKDSGEMMTLLLTALCWYETEAESGGGDSENLSS